MDISTVLVFSKHNVSETGSFSICVYKQEVLDRTNPPTFLT
jgi:hypothetical protein